MVQKPTAVDLDAAIASMEEAKYNHEWWVQYAREGRLSETQINIGGDIEHHSRWVTIYEHVLSLLHEQIETAKGTGRPTGRTLRFEAPHSQRVSSS